MARPTTSLPLAGLALAACALTPPRPVMTPPPDAAARDAAAVADAVTADAPSPACGTCPGGYAAEPSSPRLTSPKLDETSGVVESRRTPGVFFVHNDSGDGARLYAVNAEGALTAEYRLRNAGSDDWEDLAVGPCPAGTCVFLADTGDNDRARSQVTVYRVREPAPPRDAPAAVEREDVAWEALPFAYPDGPHDAETLLAHPATGDLYVVTKEPSGPSVVYALRAPHQPGVARTLERVAELRLPADAGQLVTGGDLHPCAPRLLLRTYLRLYEYELPPGEPFDRVFTVEPRRLPVLPERQGEAAGWRADGRGYVTVSEGVGAALNRYGCERP